MYNPYFERFRQERLFVSGKTIHSSKGLEAKAVFIIGLTLGNGGFPDIWMEDRIYQVIKESNHDLLLEEERRLFYVAITRAEKAVHLSFATSRYKFGTLMFCEPSRFIEEISEDFLEFTFDKGSVARQDSSSNFDETFSPQNNYKNNTTYKKKSSMPPKRSAPAQVIQTTPKNLTKISKSAPVKVDSAASLELKEGMMVNHQKFGNGIIENLDNGKATINFQNIGNKQLLLKFAKLSIIK
jgi:ATP-dependent exoDNAse (exonuclease V) beta subunit